MRKIGIIHTTSATVGSLGEMVQKAMPDTEVVNLLDDSILGDMCRQHDVEFVQERWISYAATLERLGVDAVLSACSTVGEFAEKADKLLGIPVYRIDEAMAEEAVRRGDTIAVLATLNSTLEPTVHLVERKASEAGKKAKIETVLVEGAYEALMDGNKDEHDKKIAEAVRGCIDSMDVLVLAQASMASAIMEFTEARDKVLTSPALGIRKLKEELERL